MTYQQIADEFGVSRQRVHQIYKDYKSTDENIRWEVLQFHGHECVICHASNSKENPLQVHHMDGVKTNNDFGNLTVLCRKHHIECEIEERKNLGLHIPVRKFFPAHFKLRTERVFRYCPICNTQFGPIKITNPKRFCSVRCGNSYFKGNRYTAKKAENLAKST